jgi:hypothetical protein
VNYIDAGYGIALSVLAGYAVQLWYRRRRLERLAARSLPAVIGRTESTDSATADGATADGATADGATAGNATADGATTGGGGSGSGARTESTKVGA